MRFIGTPLEVIISPGRVRPGQHLRHFRVQTISRTINQGVGARKSEEIDEEVHRVDFQELFAESQVIKKVRRHDVQTRYPYL